MDKYNFYRIEYYDNNRSVSEIANMLGTYPNAVRREMKKMGFKLKSRGQIQSELMSRGVVKNPTKGRERTREEKDKIALNRSRSWTDEEKEATSKRAKKMWADKTDEEKKDLAKKRQAGMYKSSRKGSKLEKFLAEIFEDNGEVCILHDKHSVAGKKIELDLMVPSRKLAIEVDGPSHQKIVWNEDTLERKQKSDVKKNALLKEQGFKVIRVKYNCDLSRADMVRIAALLDEAIRKEKVYEEITYEK